jgi:cardiolipin synthase
MSYPFRWDLSWLVSQVLTSFGFLLALVFLAHLLRQKRSPVSTIAWLLTIFLLPYVGVPLYLMFGGRKMQRMVRHKARVYKAPRTVPVGTLGGTTERILQSSGVPPPTFGNSVRLIPDGQSAYREVTRLIDEAERSIHITTYILGRDSVGSSIVERLARRAAKGVEVRILLDAVGSWRVGRRFLAPLTQAGARVAFFMKMIHLPFRGRANLRNHRKIVVADGRKGLVGGMNLARDYMGPDPDPERWRDLSLVVEGPAVRDLDDLFESDWAFATGGQEPAQDERPSPATDEAGSPAQVVASGPDVPGDPLYESLITLIFAAMKRVWVVTPYFVPDETLARALDLAARRGVDVRLVVPERSNHRFADLARGSYLYQIQEAGGQVLLFAPVMLHAKAVVVDDLAVVGSANVDMRSLFLNYEVALFLYSGAQADTVAAWAEGLMVECRTGLRPRGLARELAENVARLLSPLL